MFFSPELLARRDSGFGLLWLAATLGSKSTFKKLPRRSVLNADISQLCELIAQPEEPLALRLSSNLMVGVARVYKIKQEIFMNDVTNCVSSLKKVVQEIQTAATREAVHQMVQQQTRPGAFTIAEDPQALYFMEFDDFIADWDEFLNLEEDTVRVQEGGRDDEDYDPSVPKKIRRKSAPPLTEEVRADMVTLREHHDHLFSNSFDLSFQEKQREGIEASSSQAEGPAFALDDNLFPDEGLDLDLGLGDDIARELGEGWGASPLKNANQNHMDIDDEPLAPIPFESKQTGIDSDFMFGGVFEAESLSLGRFASVPPAQQKITQGQENLAPSSQAVAPASPVNSFAQLLLSQDEQPLQSESVPLADVTTNHQNNANNKRQIRKTHKRTRLLLDARTELTDEELKIARAQYLAEQLNQRREFMNKRLEKDSGKVVEELIWGVPGGIEAPALKIFWQENFQVQVEARTGLICLDIPEKDQPPKKRKRVGYTREDDSADHHMQVDGTEYPEFTQVNEGEMDEGNLFDAGWNNDFNPEPRLRSSEEPGQARQMSKPPSDIGANFSFDFGPPNGLQEGSQRSSLFPWDNAGVGSFSSAAYGGGSDRISIDRAEIRMRGSSFSHRESSLGLGQAQAGSAGARGISPGDIGIRDSQIIGEDFVFSGVDPENTQTNTQTMNTQLDSQKSDLNVITLERNSFNFLEYAKMQQKTMPSGSDSISFDIVVPKLTSTRHVAAAAFYHCLVLATKDLLHVSQTKAYENISLRVK